MANAPANIVYPIDGGTYPFTDPAPPKLGSGHINLSFSATYEGGPYIAAWKVDTDVLGEATFYDEISVQQVYKLPGGRHQFEVQVRQPGTPGTVLASDQVKFNIGA